MTPTVTSTASPTASSTALRPRGAVLERNAHARTVLRLRSGDSPASVPGSSTHSRTPVQHEILLAVNAMDCSPATDGTLDEDAFFAALASLRAKAGLSIRGLGIKARMPASTVGGYFSGRHLPMDDRTTELLVRALGVDDDELVLKWQAAAGELLRRRRLHQD